MIASLSEQSGGASAIGRDSVSSLQIAKKEQHTFGKGKKGMGLGKRYLNLHQVSVAPGPHHTEV